jgi:hypothetical protein
MSHRAHNLTHALVHVFLYIFKIYAQNFGF